MTNTVMQTQSTSPEPASDAPSPRTTEVMVILTAKEGITREQIMRIMPAEVRATVKLYLEGKIRQWYSRGDGRGVILFCFSTPRRLTTLTPSSTRCRYRTSI